MVAEEVRVGFEGLVVPLPLGEAGSVLLVGRRAPPVESVFCLVVELDFFFFSNELD